MLTEGVKGVTRILGQCVTAPGEVLDDLEIEFQETADDVKRCCVRRCIHPRSLVCIRWTNSGGHLADKHAANI